jgi:integrase
VATLTARQVVNATPGKGRRAAMLSDGANLFLQVSLGSRGQIRRSWVFKYELQGQRHEIGLGPLREVSLAEARDMASKLRRQLREGVDPLAAKRQQRQQRQLDNAKAMTFGECVEAYIAAHEAGWKNRKHRHQWQTTLTNHCRALSATPVRNIDTNAVLSVLTPLWTATPITGGRTRNRIERVLAWAKSRGLCSGENPARWSGHLQHMLVSPKRARKVRHHPALPYAELPAFMDELRQRSSLSARALEFCILTATRTAEVLGAERSEFDLDRKLWIIPASRMKGGREHRVPLSDRALAILKERPGEKAFDLGERTMLTLVNSMRPGMTTHGFRSTFRDWASECTNAASHVVELSLAHAIGTEVERSYHRTDLLEKRARLMQQWADYCERPVTSATVTPMRRLIDA